ncbi:MAG: nitroreductase [Pseudomonadota bacterium]
MTQRFPAAPMRTDLLATTRPSRSTRDLLALRRSAGKKTLQEPGPDEAELDELLRIACRVPDHRRLEPWRFITILGEARARLGKACAEIRHRTDEAPSPADMDEEETRFLRAPSVIAVVSAPDHTHKTPVWEQELSAGAVCYNLLLAANAAGWSGVWLTEWVAYDRDVATELGLSDRERIAGFIYLGTSSTASPERPRPDMSEITSRY